MSYHILLNSVNLSACFLCVRQVDTYTNSVLDHINRCVTIHKQIKTSHYQKPWMNSEGCLLLRASHSPPQTSVKVAFCSEPHTLHLRCQWGLPSAQSPTLSRQLSPLVSRPPPPVLNDLPPVTLTPIKVMVWEWFGTGSLTLEILSGFYTGPPPVCLLPQQRTPYPP